MLREAEAIGAARGPRAHEPPPSVRLGPICSGAPFLKASRTAAAGAPVGYFVYRAMVVRAGGAGGPAEPADTGLQLAVAQPLHGAVPAANGGGYQVVQYNGGVQRQPIIGVPGVGAKRPRRGAPTSDNLFSGLIEQRLKQVFVQATNKTEHKLPRWNMFTDPRGDPCEKACCTFIGVNMLAPELCGEAVYLDKEKPELGASCPPLEGKALTEAAWKLQTSKLKNCVRKNANVYAVFRHFLPTFLLDFLALERSLLK